MQKDKNQCLHKVFVNLGYYSGVEYFVFKCLDCGEVTFVSPWELTFLFNEHNHYLINANSLDKNNERYSEKYFEKEIEKIKFIKKQLVKQNPDILQEDLIEQINSELINDSKCKQLER